MPKVLRIINRFNLGGPTYNAAYLTKYLSPDYETMLVGGEKDESEETSLHILNQLGIEPVIINEMKRSINPLKDAIAYGEIKKIIRKFKPDIIHTHASKAGFLGRTAALECGVKVILHTFHGHVFHSYFNRTKTSLYKNLERYIATKSTGIIAISEKQKYELGEIHKICLPEKIKVIPLGFELDRFQQNVDEKRAAFRETYNISTDEIAIGIIGRLVPIKNHSMFIRAVKEISEKTSKNIRFFIIGDGEERLNIENLCRELQLGYTSEPGKKSLITFTSWIKDIDRANAGLDIIVLTSHNEGTPVSLIEAQASGKPIASTMVGGIEDIVIPGETALLSEKEDIPSFVANLLKLIEIDQLRKDLSIKGKDFVFEKFHYKRLVSDMKDYYSSLL
jgi:glycosyltransferase involved in cell wall biosynthesis